MQMLIYIFFILECYYACVSCVNEFYNGCIKCDPSRTLTDSQCICPIT